MVAIEAGSDSKYDDSAPSHAKVAHSSAGIFASYGKLSRQGIWQCCMYNRVARLRVFGKLHTRGLRPVSYQCIFAAISAFRRSEMWPFGLHGRDPGSRAESVALSVPYQKGAFKQAEFEIFTNTTEAMKFVIAKFCLSKRASSTHCLVTPPPPPPPSSPSNLHQNTPLPHVTVEPLPKHSTRQECSDVSRRDNE